jgi:hypothetical protein
MTLAGAIADALPPDDRMRIGIIVSVAPVTVDVQGARLPGHAVGSYTPMVGDTVAVLRQDQTWLILGKTTSDSATSTGPVFQAGSASMTVAAAVSGTQNVTFARPFTRIPAIATNINSGAGATAGWGSRAINIGLSTFQLFIFGSSSSFTAEVQWQAQEYTQ